MQFVAEENIFAGAQVIALPKGLWRAIYLSIDGTATTNGYIADVGVVRVDKKGLPRSNVDFKSLSRITDLYGGAPLLTEGTTTAFAVELPLVHPKSRSSVLFAEDGEYQLFFPKLDGGDHTAGTLEVHMIEGEHEQTHELHLTSITRTLGGQRRLDPNILNVLGVLLNEASTTAPTRIHATKDGKLISNTDWTELIRETAIRHRKEAATTYAYIDYSGRSSEPGDWLSDDIEVIYTGGAGTLTAIVVSASFDSARHAVSLSMRAGKHGSVLQAQGHSQGVMRAQEAETVIAQTGTTIADMIRGATGGKSHFVDGDFAQGDRVIRKRKKKRNRRRSLPF